MREGFSAVFNLFNAAFGLAVLFGLLWWVARSNSYWWRAVGERYAGRPEGGRLAQKVPETLIITGRGKAGGLLKGNVGFRVYGASGITLHKNGLLLRQIPPFNIMCPPLFLPFAEMQLAETDWGLNRAYALRMGALPDIDIIIFPRVARWIREHSDQAPFGLGV